MTDSNTERTTPGKVTAEDCWDTVLMLVDQVKQGRSIESALNRIEMTIFYYKSKQP